MIEAVLFDLHFTLVHQRPAGAWLAGAWTATGREGRIDDALDQHALSRLRTGLEQLWQTAAVIDPHHRRDLDPHRHRAVFDQVVGGLPGTDAVLTDALYATLPDVWTPFPDTVGVLRGLHETGVRTVVLSNVGIDVRPVLTRTGIADWVDGVVLSFEHGVAKPDPAIFRRALEAARVPAHRALMVGDNWRDDGAAADLGIRTLILPAPGTDGTGPGTDGTGPGTDGTGLRAVLALVADARN